MTDKWQIRAYRESDIPGLVDMINAADGAVGLPMRVTGVDLKGQFDTPGLDPLQQVIVAEAAPGEDVQGDWLLGYGRAFPGGDRDGKERVYGVSMRVQPGIADSGLAIAIAKELARVIRRHEALPGLRQVGKVRVRSYIYEKHAALREAWQAVGLREVRQAWTMHRKLSEAIAEPADVTGITLRTYKYPEDNGRSLLALNTSFADYFDSKSISAESWDREMAAHYVRHDLSWLAQPEGGGDELAGFCMCLVNQEENAQTGSLDGWIEGIGTVPEWRGRGVGKALLLHALHSLKGAGMEMALADVDAQGPSAATRMFEAAGFTVRDRMYQYECALSDITNTKYK